MSDMTVPLHEALEPDALVEVADKPREPTAYEKKLRTEAKQYRLRALEAERLREEAVAAVQRESDRKIESALALANERVIRAELKAHALKAGIVDLDGLRLIDLSSVRTNAAGEVEGADTLIAGLRAAKPWLFGQASSSSVAKVPAEQPTAPKNAMQMTVDEWKMARKEMLRRR